VTSRDPGLAALPVIAVACCLAYAPMFSAERALLGWDDGTNILQNPLLHGPWPGWAALFNTRVLGVWEPVATALKWATVQGFGVESARPFHLITLAVHALNAWLVYALGRSLITRAGAPERAGWGALIAALLFALHPLRVEVVAWASGQPYALAALGTLASVAAYTCYLESSGRRAAAWLAASGLAAGFALASKSAAIFLPGVLFVLDAYPYRRKPSLKLLAEKLPHLLIVAGVLRVALMASEGDDSENVFDLSPGARLAVAVHQVVIHPLRTLWPVDLAPIYPVHSADLSLAEPRFALPALAGLLITAGLVAARRRAPGLTAAWLVFLGALLPVSGLVSHGMNMMGADRYSYLSLAGPAIVAGWWLAPRLADRRVVAGLAALLVLWGGLTARQAAAWADDEALWGHTLRVHPANFVAMTNLGHHRLAKGEFVTAWPLLHKSWLLQPGSEKAVLNLGYCLEQLGRLEEARVHYHIYLEGWPDAARVHHNLGVIYAKFEDAQRSQAHFGRARALGFNPGGGGGG